MNSNSIISNNNEVVWQIIKEPIDYLQAVQDMEILASQVINYEAPETIWLLSHPHVYTKGSSASENELLSNNNIPVITTSRGGKITYHGPGQKVIYPILDLRKRGKDLKLYINKLELWIIKVLDELGIKAYQKPDFIGVWVKHGSKESKIAAIGVRVSKWVTSHGIALNVNPNLDFFKGIIPCGIRSFGVTSLEQLNVQVEDNTLNKILQESFLTIFKN